MTFSSTNKGVGITACLLAIVGTASAQSASTAWAINDWYFGIATNSASTSMGITNDGDHTYQLTAPNNLQAANYPDGSGQANDYTIAPTFSATGGNGQPVIVLTASSGQFGSAWATLGHSQSFDIVNLDPTNVLSLLIGSSITLNVQASKSGNSYYAGAEAYVGTDFDLNQKPLTSIFEGNYDDTLLGYSSSGSGDYIASGGDGSTSYYYTYTTISLNPGDDLFVNSYASADVVATSAPAPSTGLTLAFGLASFGLLRRRHSSKNHSA